MHSFGENNTHYSPVENIDEETWLERFHDWKHNLWHRFRYFLHDQLSYETRDALREKQAGLSRRSRVINVAQFAQIPLLNDKQLVARWHQQMPPTFVSDSQVLPIDPLAPGMYLVEATDAHLKAYTILMISETALVTRSGDNGTMMAFVVDRKSGTPVSGANVSLGLRNAPTAHAITGDDGLATLTPGTPVEPAKKDKPANTNDTENYNDNQIWMLARSGNDVALVAPWYSFNNGQQADRSEGYVYTDRPVYRPGHTVHWKAIVREVSGNALALPRNRQSHVVINDPTDKAVFEKDMQLSDMGTTQGDITLPTSAALGSYSIRITTDDAVNNYAYTGYANFTVEEYRKPEYQVHVTTAKPRVLQGDSNTATIDARFFFGEPVANANVKYTIHQSAHYWWGEDEDSSGNNDPDTPSDTDNNSDAETYGAEELEQTGKLDADGKLTVKIPTRFIEQQHEDKDYVIEAGVTDEAGREISGRYRFLATYGSYRIHIEPTSYFAQKGSNASFNITAVDYDDKPVATKVHIHLITNHYGSSSHSETVAGDADTTTGPDGKATLTVPVTTSGSLNITASSHAPENRTVEATTWLWVSSNDVRDDDSYGNDQQKIIADKKSYAPGDIAHLSIVGNIDNFHAFITAAGYTLEFKKVLTSTGKALTFDLPISTDSQPNITVQAVFLKDEKIYQATKVLSVPPVQQQLQIEVKPAAQTFQPQQTAAYDVTARDFKGNPVSAELSFGVVDEAIYSLYRDTSGDIVKQLYPNRYNQASFDSSLDFYFSGTAGDKSPLLAERHARFRPQLAQVKPSSDVVQPRIRKDFPDTAFWQPAVHTDAQGHARVTLTFPDSFTTWRATVRAITADSKAGSTVNRVIVRKNIIVRMGQPRFLRKGDVITIPVIVHNYLPDTKSIQLSLAATGADIIGGAPQQVTVGPKQDATAYWKLRATNIGTATLTAKALSTQESDALEISLPVKPSGVRRTLNAAGSIKGDGDSTLPVNFPTSTDPAAHTLSVEVSPSIAGTLFSALDYLTSFPYGCTEQTMSSFLPNVIVGQAAQKLHLQSRINQTSLDAKVKAGIDRLASYQHDDGGWGWWKEDKSQVFMTAYVVSGLAQAQKAGYSGEIGAQSRQGIAFLQKLLEQHPRMIPALRAYVVYALAESGTFNKQQLDTLWSRRNDLDAQALSYVGLAMLDAKDARATDIAHLLESKVREQGEFANWPSGYNDLMEIEYDASSESTAIALKFLVAADPQSPLLPKAAQWLVASRNQGYFWSSTQQTAFVLFGLTDYLVSTNELAGDSDAEIFLNNVSLGKRRFTQTDALSGATLQFAVDASHLQQQNTVHIVTHGAGRRYFTVAGSYFSTDKSSYQQGTMQLNIARDYFRLVPSHDASNNIVYTLEPLHSPVQQGDVLAVHLGITGSPSKYLLIEDPIPAGTEFLQNEQGYNIISRPSTWDWWYTRREFHDDHAAIFADDFNTRHESFYLLKVVNPGSFAISPASVAPMYQPGVLATTDELHLDVKDVQ